MAEELKILITCDDQASRVIQGTNKSLFDLGDIAKGALTFGFAAASAGAVALGAGLVSSVGAATEAQNVMADLDATLASTGAALAQQVDGIVQISPAAAEAIKKVADEHSADIVKVAQEAADKAADLASRVEDIESAHADKMIDIAGSIAKTQLDYESKREEAARKTTEKLNDLDWAHMLYKVDNKIKLEALEEDTNNRILKVAQSLSEQLIQLDEQQADKRKAAQARLNDVVAAWDEGQASRKENLEESVTEVKEQAEEKRADLIERLGNATTDKERVRIQKEIDALDANTSKRIDKLNTRYAKEQEKLKAKHDRELADLRARLATEEEQYQKQQVKLNARAVEETETIKAEQDKRVQVLLNAMGTEEAEYRRKTVRVKEEADRATKAESDSFVERMTQLQAAKARENKEYEKQTAKIAAERAKIEAITKASLAKVEADFAESTDKIKAKFSGIELGLAPIKKIEQISREALISLAEQFQNTTRFEDDITLKGEAMLLTFTNIGKNVFPQATEAMLNMGQKFGSVDAAALQLGKALNDPIEGIGALRRVGVMLTDQQEAQIKKYMALGDIEGAQKIILGELQTEFGGLAVAAGQTFAGKLDIVKNKFGDVQEEIGGAMLPALSKLGDGLIKALDDPVVKAAIASISDWLATKLPVAIEMGAALLEDLKKNGITGVLTKAQTWVDDPTTQTMLRGVGDKIGTGIVAGVESAATNIPAWAAMGTKIGDVAIPIMANVGGSIGVAVYNSIMEKLGIPFRLGIAPAGGAAPAVSGFASGGIVPGPMGAPQLAVVHGGETITPVGGGGNFTFVYSPMISLADEREAQTRLAPVLNQWWANAKRMRTA